MLARTPAQERAGGEICRKGNKDTILTSYPGTDLRDNHWGCIIKILEFTKGTNSGSLKISGRGLPRAYHATIQKNGSISVVG